MPLNINPFTAELLAWHSHDRGGVRVPFQPGDRPLGRTIDTTLILRLRRLAQEISQGRVGLPRWIFLVGGPGNGKSEAVESFLTALDQELGLSGSLIAALSASFAAGRMLKRRVEVRPGDLSSGEDRFRGIIGRLILIQDATATEDPSGDAARALAQDLADLYTSGENPAPFFLVCANRGLLARAINEASRDYGPDNAITKLLSDVIRASGLGLDALARDRMPCWPLSTDAQAACWPLDLESLLVEVQPGTVAPVAQAVAAASDDQQWEITGRCLDCDAKDNCPLRQNSVWLRDSGRVSSLVRILRGGELATGQRWNFRGLFSLVAEIIVGEWTDFTGFSSPCQWVHAQHQALADENQPQAVDAAFRLTRRLYPHALFSSLPLTDVARTLLDKATNLQPRSQRFLSLLAAEQAGSSAHMRYSQELCMTFL